MTERRVITLDFHNTLVECDAWFQMEIRTLVSAFLEWMAKEELASPSPVTQNAAIDEYRAIRRAIHEHGHELPADRSISVVLERLGILVDAEIMDQGLTTLMQGALTTASPVTGAADTVRQLSESGFELAVVSSAVYHPFLEWALAKFGMRSHFAVITTSASSGFYKSRPEIYWQTLETMGATPTGAVHVGDSLLFDVRGAQRAGMRTVWYSRGEAESHDGFLPDAIVETMTDAAPVIAAVLRADTSR